MDAVTQLTALGGRTDYRYENPGPEILEVFDNVHLVTPWVVQLECSEFTSLCPVTGQPDFATLHIRYVPDKLCVESKSLKLYLGAYRNEGSFHEDVVNRIADDLMRVMNALYLEVFGDFRARGGIAIRPSAFRTQSGLDVEQERRLAELVSRAVLSGDADRKR